MQGRMQGLKYELVPCIWLTTEEIESYVDEFRMHGEEENVLWEIGQIGAETWKTKIAYQKETLYGAFLVDDELVGVCRITKEPKHDENGKVGLSIRPGKRGCGYAGIFLNMIANAGSMYEVENLTACVDCRNERSMKAFEAAGWKRSGRKFAWRPNPHPREAIEFVLDM